MKTELSTNLTQWKKYIAKCVKKSTKPDHSETIKPFTINWELYGRIVIAKHLNGY